MHMEFSPSSYLVDVAHSSRREKSAIQIFPIKIHQDWLMIRVLHAF